MLAWFARLFKDDPGAAGFLGGMLLKTRVFVKETMISMGLHGR